MSKISFSLFIVAISLFSVSPASFAGDLETVKACLSHWEKHPFNTSNPKFRIYSTKVRVFGIGGNVSDTTPTDRPDLVLVKPNVNVMTKSTMELMNPNGWYCLRGKVNVLSSTTIKLHCKAHLASSSSGVTVLGGGNSSEREQETTVLGGARVNLVGCKENGSVKPSLPGRSHVVDKEVLDAQIMLNKLGYSAGVADGINGPKTKNAIRVFQGDYGLEGTGKLDDATTNSLNIAVENESGNISESGRLNPEEEEQGGNTRRQKQSADRNEEYDSKQIPKKPDVVTQLMELEKLRKSGVINEEEFETLKARVIQSAK